MTDDNLLIHYFLIISDDIKTSSPFAAFNPNLYPYINIIPIIQRFPIDIFELGKNDYSKADYRYKVSRGHKIITLMYDNYIKFIPKMKFSCIIYDSKKFPKLKSISKNWEVQPLYIELNNINNIKSDDFFYHFVKDATKYLNSNGCSYNFKLEPPYNINFDRIIDVLLKNMMPTFMIKGSREELQQEIRRANSLLIKTLSLGNHSSKYIDLIITSVPIIKNKKLEEIFLSKINETEIVSTKHLLNQKDYINETIISENNSFFYDRYNEIYMYITCMKIVFENYHAPIIQLEPGIQTNTNMYLTNINKSKTPEKRKKSYKTFLDVVNSYYNNGFYEFIPTNKIPRIKIYSDGPAEFICHPTEKIPLLISTNICKIPMTPGADLFNQISTLSDTYVSYSDLSNILIIRSFKDDDEIKYSFEKRLESTKQLTNLKIKIIDVNNTKEVIKVLNTNRSYNLVIFDCHGKQDLNDTYGVLQLKDEDFNIWHERDKIEYIPPIVLFSACQTNIYNNNTFSVANGFFAAGAKSSLATTCKVDPDLSADFMARILLKIDAYKELLKETIPEITWLDFLANIFRIFFINDILNHFQCDSDFKNQIIINETVYVNNADILWFQYLLQNLSKYLQKDIASLQNEILYDCGYCESLKYIILGNADKIILS